MWFFQYIWFLFLAITTAGLAIIKISRYIWSRRYEWFIRNTCIINSIRCYLFGGFECLLFGEDLLSICWTLGNGNMTGKYLHKDLGCMGTFQGWIDIWVRFQIKPPRAHGSMWSITCVGTYFPPKKPHLYQWLGNGLQRTQLSPLGLCVPWTKAEKHFSGTKTFSQIRAKSRFQQWKDLDPVTSPQKTFFDVKELSILFISLWHLLLPHVKAHIRAGG